MRVGGRGEVLVAALTALAACGSGAEREHGRALTPKGSAAPGAIVATVDGEPITAVEVDTLVKASGLSPKDALARLEAERLLAAYAERRGYGELASVTAELKRARVRALLETVIEAEVTPQSISDAAVRARFEELRPRLERPELRHVRRVRFARKQGELPDRPRAMAQELLDRVATLGSSDAMLAELGRYASPTTLDGVSVTGGVLHLKAGDKGPDPQLNEAVFALGAPGLVPHVVESAAGFDVVALTGIDAAVVAKVEELADKIREQLVKEGRAARLEALVAQLTAATKVTYDEAAIERALADDRTLGALP